MMSPDMHAYLSCDHKSTAVYDVMTIRMWEDND